MYVVPGGTCPDPVGSPAPLWSAAAQLPLFRRQRSSNWKRGSSESALRILIPLYRRGSHKSATLQLLKAAFELPGAIHRRAKSNAAAHGVALSQFVTEAIHEKLMT